MTCRHAGRDAGRRLGHGRPETAPWGRKGRIALADLSGAQGTITYDQERLNELQIFRAGRSRRRAGVATLLMGRRIRPMAISSRTRT